MTRLEQLTIKNFRGFDSLEIDGFSNINLFVGKNNSGKTTVLEAVFLLLGMSNPMLPSNINAIRGLGSTHGTAKQLKYLFHNLLLDHQPSFYGKFNDAAERWLELKATFQQNGFLNAISSFSVPAINGIELSFSYRKGTSQKQTDKSAIVFESNNGIVNHELPKNYHEAFYTTFIPADKNDAGTLSRLSEIVKKKSEAKILDALRNAFDQNIVGILPFEDGIFFNLKDVDEYIPSNIMGDGIRRFLNIVTTVSERQNAFVCIDEIENGLHYSAYEWLWRSLLSFSNLNNVQLFITTHNIETLACLTSVLEEKQFEYMQEYAKVFTVSKTVNSGYKAYRYSFEGFKDAIDYQTEIRN